MDGGRADVREGCEVLVSAGEVGGRAAEQLEGLLRGQAEEALQLGERGGDGGEGAEVQAACVAGVDGEGLWVDLEGVDLGGRGLERYDEGELRRRGGAPRVEEGVEPVEPGGRFGVLDRQDDAAAGLDKQVVRVAVRVREPQFRLDLRHLRLGALADEAPFQARLVAFLGTFRCNCEASVVHEAGLGEQGAVYLDGPA